MNHEIPRPETSHTPEISLFNVDAMSDEQIIVLSRGLTGVLDSEEVGGGRRHGDTAAGMLAQLDTDLSGLASRDPERIRGLIEQCVQSDMVADHELALGMAPSLVGYDYTFARDTLISIRIDGVGGAEEEAMMRIPRIMRDQLTPDQTADFNAHLQARGEEPVIPDGPDI
jgi:hypothetical protein